MKTMERKRNKGVWVLAALICALILASPMKVHAFVEGDANAAEATTDIVIVAEETAETDGLAVEETVETEAMAEETEVLVEAAETAEETEAAAETSAEDTGDDTAFSVSGNGELLDDITDDETKEFITVTTANGNTYFLIIDRSSSTENVYLLSLIDEYDLQDFIEDAQTESTSDSSQSSVVLDETSVQTGTEAETSETEESKSGGIGANGVMLLMIVLVAGGGGVYFYFRVYKPKQEHDGAESEGMEYGDGIPTEKDDADDDEDTEE